MNQKISLISSTESAPFEELFLKPVSISFLIKGENKSFCATSQSITDEEFTVKFASPAEEAEFIYELVIRKNVIVNFNYRGVMWGFETEVVGASIGTFSCRNPIKMFEINRRRSDRNRIPEVFKSLVSAEMYDLEAPLLCSVVDLSVDGFKIEVPSNQMYLFKKFQELKWKLKVNGKPVSILAEVRNSYSSGDGKSVFVGLQMKSIAPLDQVWIRKFCLEKLSA